MEKRQLINMDTGEGFYPETDPQDRGMRGEKGDPGPAGKSAYEIAVEHGYGESESEWLLSLKGRDGAPGVPGQPGEKGDQGPAGERGEKGDQGLEGERGEKGDPGTAGKSAYEIAVEHGYGGSESEWLLSLKGRDGAPGAPGQPGEKGDQGPAGERGEKGDQGPAGKRGERGEPGAAGTSAYEIAVEHGFAGTEEEWLEGHGAATESSDGLMSAADNRKLDGIEEGADRTRTITNMMATVPGTPLDATVATVIQGELDELKGMVAEINSNLGSLSGFRIAYFGKTFTFDGSGESVVEEAGHVTEAYVTVSQIMNFDVCTFFGYVSKDGKLVLHGYKGIQAFTGEIWLTVFGLVR